MTVEEAATAILDHEGIDLFWDYDEAHAHAVGIIRAAIQEALGA